MRFKLSLYINHLFFFSFEFLSKKIDYCHLVAKHFHLTILYCAQLLCFTLQVIFYFKINTLESNRFDKNILFQLQLSPMLYSMIQAGRAALLRL